jgi:hypothetical protein
MNVMRTGAALSCAVVVAVGCGGSGAGGTGAGGTGGGGGTTAGTINISGTLAAASAAAPGMLASTAVRALTISPGPLAGYRLYCVTLSTPPVSGAATADAAGAVSLTLAAEGLPFGCFVQEPSGSPVAAVMFSRGADVAPVLTLSGSASFGTIAVDASAMIAEATAPVAGALVSATPAGAGCPAGLWTFTVSDTETCGGTATGTALVTQVGANLFALTNIYTLSGSMKGTLVPPTGTYAGNTLSFAPFNNDPGGSCDGRKSGTISISFDGACASGAGTMTQAGPGGGGACPAECCCGLNTITFAKR